MALDADDVMMSGWRQCFCSRGKQSAHQISCGQMQIVTRCVPAWLEHVVACVHIVDVAHSRTCRWHFYVVASLGAMKAFVRSMFVTQDEPYFSTAGMISPGRSSGWCVFAFFSGFDSACLHMCVSVCRACVRACVFFCRAEERGRSEPAATLLGLKFACFPPICNPQPSHRQRCMLACSWCLSQRQLRSLPVCQIGCDVRRWPARMKRFDVGPRNLMF